MILSNYNFVSKYTLLIFTFSLLFYSVQGQIMITSGEEITPLMLVENIVGEGVQYSNVQYQGAELAKGIFSNGLSTNIGIPGGIILTSGFASIVQGPNFQTGATGSNGAPGDATLTGLAGQPTFDAAVLQFDFIPESDTLRFRYVFGSEEYPEYVTNLYNDLFGYFVTGPNPDGGEYASKNVAIVPGSMPELPVTIATINDVYPSYEWLYVDNTGGLTIEYDGFTVVLTAFVKVVACEQYHIKMAVADAGDGVLDTGVLLEENSFESPKIEVQTDPYPAGVSDNMIEGCVEADIIFELPNASYAPITVDFEIITGAGYATNGIDYGDIDGDEIDPWVTFEEGEDSVAIHVVPKKDGSLEGEELIEFVVTNELGCIIRYDTVTFVITDYVDMVDTISASTVICQGQEIDLWVSVGNGIPLYTFSWEPEPSDNDTITVSPEETTTYTVTITDMCQDSISDSTTVTVFPLPVIDLGPDSMQICEEDTLTLNAGGGYLAYQWQNDPNYNDSTFVVTETNTYVVTVYGPGACYSGDTIYVERIVLDMDIGNDTSICEGDSVVLTIQEGFETYEWQDGSSGLTMVAKDEGWYSLIVTRDGCSKKDSIFLQVDDPSSAIDLGDNQTVCQGEYVTIGSNVMADFLWSTGDTTATITVTEPNIYILTAEFTCGNSTDTIQISNWPYPDPALGDDQFLCSGQYTYIEAQSGFASYAWNNEPPTLQNSLLVSESNYYYVQVEDYNECLGNDTVFVQIGNEVELGPAEMTLCEGDSIVLDAGSEFDFYTWNGEPGPQTKTIYDGGIFQVTVGYEANEECGSEDQVIINYFELPVAEITSEDYFCAGESIDLNAPAGVYTYYWNDDPPNENAQLTIDEGGLYSLKMENLCGTDSTDKMIEQHESPGVNLGEDQLLFPDGSVTLDAGVYETYEWNNDPALNSQFLTINENDISSDTTTVYVEVFDGYCYNKDGVFIEIFNVKVPTVITPNGDGDNDLFIPFVGGWAGIHDHTITVFNRWGEQVWESNDFPSGWDGKENGNLVADGTYFWVLDVKYGPENLSRAYKGTLSVLGTGK